MQRFLTKNQRLLLALFYTNPGKAFYLQEIGRILGKSPGVFQRTLNHLVEDGVLTSDYRGRARFFQANTRQPVYRELKGIIAKTAGVEASLRALVEGVHEITMALLYGSFAKGIERGESDVDLLVVGAPKAERQLLRGIPRLEKLLQREINYKLYTEAEYGNKRSTGDPFLEEVLRNRHVVLKGSPYAV